MNTIQRIIEIPLSELQTGDVASGKIDPTVTGGCLLCGKKLGKNPKMIHLLTNGNIVSYNGEDIENTQGFFPVGNECAKKLIIQFAF